MTTRLQQGAALIAAFALSASTARAQFPKPPLPKPPAPPAPGAPKPPDLNALRDEIAKNKYRFQVGPNGVFGIDLKNLTGLIVPGDIEEIAKSQEPISRRLLELDKQAREAAVQRNPALRAQIYEFNIAATPTMKKWDWRSLSKVTPIKNQKTAGTCWAFSCTGALESSFLIRANRSFDLSEQFMVSYSGAGSIKGGSIERGNTWLVAWGTVQESVCPYNATNFTPTPITVTAAYDALAWGFVQPSSGGMPSVGELKKALCEHGPLEVTVYADDAFKGYNGGVFDHVDTSHKINHAVMLVGWDDEKESWIIKNSWGTDWGETCGIGNQKGYMFIKYGTHQVGRWACWIKSKPILYTISPDLLKAVPTNPRIKFDVNRLRP